MDWQCPENIAPRPRAYQYQSLPTETKEEQRSFSDEAFLPNVPANHYSGDLAEAYGTPSVSQSHEPPQRSASTQLDDAWRLDFGIAPRWVFIAAVGDDGTTSSYDSSGRLLSPEVTSQFFNGERYNQVIHRLEADMNPMLSIEESLLSHQSTCISQISNSQSRSFVARNDKVLLSGRTRQRPVEMQRSDDDRMLGIPRSRTTLIIGNSDAVWNFYETEFKACQQKACKLIAKAWIKEVEPKKQSTHPYAGGDEKAPEWWPKPWGPRVSDKVRHKEPDHLYKQERIQLLAHILRLVLESKDKQHPEVRKVGLNLTKLQDATWNALSPFFMENTTNALKRQHLMEIFKVAALEQKYRNGELDGATVIFINDTNDIGDSLSGIEGGDGV